MWKLTTLFKVRIKTKKTLRVLEFNQSQWLKPYVEFNTEKRVEAEKNGDKDRKALYKLMNNAAYGKTMKNLRNRIDLRLVSNEKGYLIWASKPNHMSQKNIWQWFSCNSGKQSFINT